MPLFEEKLISPLAVRYSQERIRPTFQDGRELDTSLAQIEASACDISASVERRYTVLLRAPFPPIEVIRWQPRRGEDGERPPPRWITFDNRRLCCLQRAAAAHWPRVAAAVVRVLYDMPVERSAVRKMGHAAAGTTVFISRLRDDRPYAWDWAAAARCLGGEPEAVVQATAAVEEDASMARLDELVDAPEAAMPERPLAGGQRVGAAQLLGLAARLESEVNLQPSTRAVDAAPTRVARLFELAAEQDRALPSSWPVTPPRTVTAQDRHEDRQFPDVTPPKNLGGKELLSLIKGKKSPDQQDANGARAGRELLGLLNPTATASKQAAASLPQRRLVGCEVEVEAEHHSRIAADIWGALGRGPGPPAAG